MHRSLGFIPRERQREREREREREQVLITMAVSKYYFVL
jgi:hypothetical protein